VHAFDVLGDPVRRRILELLADGESPAGEVADAIRNDFGISKSAVSQHLRVLRDSGFVTMRADRQFRVYAIRGEPFREVDAWLQRYRRFWTQRLDALDTEIVRKTRERRE